jgi:S1-C subfamily serine protease/pSer/pThr/pTyr-binding forkhead associated (FHA) protein
MDRIGFVHLGGPRSGEAAWLPRLPATIGSDPDADVLVPAIAPRHAVVFERDGEVVLLDSGSPQGTYLGGQLVQEAVLRPGDEIALGADGPRLRFQRDGMPLTSPRPYDPSEVEPLAAAAPPPASHTLVLRAMAQSSRAFRRALVLAGVVAAVLLGWAWRENRRIQAEVATLRQQMGRVETERRTFEQRVDAERRRGDAERQTLERRIEDYRSREEELRSRLTGAAAGEVQSLRDELGTTQQRIASLETERVAGEEIIRQYGGGVCLIQGAYAFYDKSERPLRYKEGLDDHAGAEEGTAVLTPEGEGPVHIVEYYGTGFLVKAGGLVLTNRHVAEPWWNDTTAGALQGQGYAPRFLYLRAFFPGHRDPYELRLERSSERYDLSLLRAALKGRGVPVLPLEPESKRTQAGQPVIVVGYPTGLEAILAKAESSVVRKILESHGTDSERVTLALSRQDLIRPSTTQGHIGDITRTDIVFDAPSAQGGSGGPVFNKYGQVIAVEYAVLQKFGGNSFGIPIAYARELLAEPHRPRSDD